MTLRRHTSPVENTVANTQRTTTFTMTQGNKYFTNLEQTIHYILLFVREILILKRQYWYNKKGAIEMCRKSIGLTISLERTQ